MTHATKHWPYEHTIVVHEPSPRLRVRRVNTSRWAALARKKAMGSGEWYVLVKHGGAVTNSYGYDAKTEAALIVSDPQGRVVVWMAKLRANKVTEAGAAEACLPGTRALWDKRFSPVMHAGVMTIIQAAHAEHRPTVKRTMYERLITDDF